MLKRNGYKIKVFNTINFSKSMHYNPFMYISNKHPEKDILKIVNVLMANTKGDGEKSGDDFWTKAERLLYIAYIAYIYYELPKEDRTFITLLAMIDESQTSEEDESFQNPIDIMFENLAKRKPFSFAVRQYKKYKLAAGKTAKSILISCAARLAPFDIEELREITRYDDLELDLTGDRKTALFVIISDTDDTFNFLVSMMYSQLFNILCERADDRYKGRLPVHVRCLLDEMANIGQIGNFDKLIATIRSREISAAIILQAKSQLKSIYKDKAETIEGNCDTLLFLGGREKSTIKDMSEMLGKETIDLLNTSETYGSSPGNSISYQKNGLDLMSPDAISVMDGEKCILSVRGLRPFFSDKYNIEEHPQYKYLSDYDERNYFDLEKYVKSSFRDGTRLKLNSNDSLEVTDVGIIEKNELKKAV